MSSYKLQRVEPSIRVPGTVRYVWPLRLRCTECDGTTRCAMCVQEFGLEAISKYQDEHKKAWIARYGYSLN